MCYSHDILQERSLFLPFLFIFPCMSSSYQLEVFLDHRNMEFMMYDDDAKCPPQQQRLVICNFYTNYLPIPNTNHVMSCSFRMNVGVRKSSCACLYKNIQFDTPL